MRTSYTVVLFLQIPGYIHRPLLHTHTESSQDSKEASSSGDEKGRKNDINDDEDKGRSIQRVRGSHKDEDDEPCASKK